MSQPIPLTGIRASMPGDIHPSLVALWVGMQLTTQLGLLMLIATFVFSLKVFRLTTLVSACTAWLLRAVIYSILFYAGKQIGPEPPLELCVIQSILVYAIQPTTALASLGIYVEAIKQVQTMEKKPVLSRTWKFLLLGFPYLVFVVWTIVATAVIATNGSLVSRERRVLYCTANYRALSITTASVTAGIAIVIAILNAVLMYLIWKYRRTMSGTSQLHHLVRMALLGVFIVALCFFSVAFAHATRPVGYDIALSIGGVIFFLFFASARDVLSVWLSILCYPWRRAVESRAALNSSEEKV